MRFSSNQFQFLDSNYVLPGIFKDMHFTGSNFILQYLNGSDSLLGSHRVRPPNIRIKRDSMMSHQIDTINSLVFYLHLPANKNIRFLRLLKDSLMADTISVLPATFINIPAMY
jgi:hypothetical protein